MLAELFQKITRRKKESVAALAQDVRQLAIQIGRSELGLSKDKIDVDHAAILMDASEMSEAEFRALVDAYKERVRKNKLAAQLEGRQSEAVRLEREAREFDEAEGVRHRAAMRKLAELQDNARRAQTLHEEAVTAHGDLVAAAPLTDEERQLGGELVALNKQADRLKAMIAPHRPSNMTSGYATMIGDNPGAMVRETRESLAAIASNSKSVNRSPARKAELTARLALAERAVADRQAELAKLESCRAEIDERLVALAADKLLPEAIPAAVKLRTSRDEQSKQHAREMGYASVR